jgi:hypothetical protein
MWPMIIFGASLLFALYFGRLSDRWARRDVIVSGTRVTLPSRVMAAPGQDKVTEKAPPATRRSGTVRMVMQILISLSLLGCSLYIIVSGSSDGEHDKWAYGTIGTVVGFWFKG